MSAPLKRFAPVSISALLPQVRRATHRKLTHSAANASIADFDKKLSETDAYLELLLAQMRKLQDKADKAETEEAKAK